MTYRMNLKARSIYGVALGLAIALVAVLFSSVPASAATREHIVNGNFAQGTHGWKTNKPEVHPWRVEKLGTGNSNAAVITPKNSETIVFNDAIDSLQGAPAGQTYDLKARVKSSTGEGVAAIKAREGSASGGVITHEERVRFDGSKEWKEISLSFTTRAKAKWVDINVLFWGLTAEQSVYIDSVSLTSEEGSGGDGSEPALPQPPDGTPSCVREVPEGTMFGTSISTSSQNHAQAVEKIDSLFGEVPIIRVFDPGMPFPWTHQRTGMIAGKDLVMSFRPMPQEVLAGKHDRALRDWFAQAPSDVTIFWSYIHEPEPLIDQGRFTAEEYRRAWQHIAEIADSQCRENMFSTLILTGWTTQPASKRDWRTYYPGDDVIDVMAFDPYNGVHDPERDYYASPESMFDSVRKVAAQAGKPYGIAETGSRRIPSDTAGNGRAGWLMDLATYHRHHGAVFVTYFQSSRDGAWELLEQPETDVWAKAILSSR